MLTTFGARDRVGLVVRCHSGERRNPVKKHVMPRLRNAIVRASSVLTFKKLGRPLDLGREYSPLGAVTVFILSHPHLNLPPSMGKTYKALYLSSRPVKGEDLYGIKF